MSTDAKQAFLDCTIATHPSQVVRYIGTTEAGTVWLAYPDQDPEEVAEAFRRRGSFASDVMTELAGLRFNGIQLDATIDELIENRRQRMECFHS